MAVTREQKAIVKAASQKIQHPISNRIFRLIIVTAIGLGVISIILTAIMFYNEFRHLILDSSGEITDQAASGLLKYMLIYLVLMTGISLVVATLVKRYAARTIVEPIDQIAEAASGYISDKSDGTLDDIHFHDLHISSGDELEHLAIVLRDMEHSMQKYVDNLTKVTREKERISTELDLARRIQNHMLPNVFPPYPNRKEFDIYASMDPAKEVGGDFYDFFLVDDDHLGLVMADVSGKGIPAALFMMMARIMINSMALTGISPLQVLRNVNEKICENNADNMFVTVWLGVLTISTGEVVAANAGHEYPMIRKPNGMFEMVKDPHSFVVGCMEGTKFREYNFTMEPGTTIFLYTDGLPEATNADDQLFGTDRVLSVLNEDPAADPEALLHVMTERVAGFVGSEPQFDDLTMMAFRLNETMKDTQFVNMS